MGETSCNDVMDTEQWRMAEKLNVWVVGGR
jgi:hypothetical protein